MPYDPKRHGPKRIVGPGFHDQVYRVVIQVPAGFVTTYGDVATVLGMRSVARHVGYALAGLPSERRDVPWHRVVNGRGRISHADPGRQRALLHDEGVSVNDDGRIVDFSQVRLELEFLRQHAPGAEPA